ncbi:MAG: FAD:protein FMN transferase [Planctomycetaceae bacterium]
MNSSSSPNSFVARGKALPCLMLLFLAFSPACFGQEPLTGECMGTTWSVTINGPVPEKARERIQAELDLVDKLMSTWREDSEISRFNTSESTDWFDVSPATAHVISAAQDISDKTKGAFDITVSPLIALWNFDKNTGRAVIPPDEDIAACQKKVGWKLLSVRLEPPALRKSVPTLSINLSSIAKGYAVDRVADALGQLGLEGFLVEVGGEVRAAGLSPRGKPWAVGLEEPNDTAREVRESVSLRDQAMATSGDYRNFYIVDGKRYSHTIDPRTGRPIEHGLASVSVLSEACMQADAWATAISVMGPKAGRKAASDFGLATRLVVRNPRGLAASTVGAFEVAPLAPPNAGPKTSMWPVFAAAAIVFLLAIGGMAMGVIISNRRLKGSCGGLSGMTDESGQTACDLCSIPAAECRNETFKQAATATEKPE